jgi:nucleoside-specific outer membrane channel protein Tsx
MSHKIRSSFSTPAPARFCLVAGLALAVAPQAVMAEMYWSDFSLSYLNGDNYEVGDDSREVLSVEHASGHNWGDNFFFMDRLISEDDSKETYFELAPRLSLSYISQKKLSVGPLTDVFIATTWEGDSSQFSNFDNYLYGIGTSITVPGFKYFTVNVYKANNELIEDDEQLTITWGLPFALATQDFLYDGFLDWSSAQDDHASEMNFTSQLKWNAGKLIDTKAPFYLGVEYAYWNNKFGIPDITEKNPSLLVKWHF